MILRTVAALSCSRLWRATARDPTGRPVTMKEAITQCRVSRTLSFKRYSLASIMKFDHPGKAVSKTILTLRANDRLQNL